AQPGEGRDGDRHHDRFGAAGQDGVGGVVPDQPGALADGVGAGGAGGGHADVGARPAEFHGQDGGGGVGHHHRHEEGRDPGRAPLDEDLLLVLEGGQPADADPGHHGAAGGIGAGVAGVAVGVDAGREAQLGVAVDPADL